MSKSSIIIYVSLFCSSLIFSQNHEVCYEGGAVISVSNSIVVQEIYELDNGYRLYEQPILKIKDKYFHTYSLSFYYSGKIVYAENKFEIRPGIFLGDSYTGLEFGLFYRRNIYGSIYGIVGLNLHYNIHFSEGNFSGYSTEEGFYYNPCFGVGFKISKSISLSLVYEYVSNKRIYSDHYFNPNGPSTRGYKNLEGILKINMEI